MLTIMLVVLGCEAQRDLLEFGGGSGVGGGGGGSGGPPIGLGFNVQPPCLDYSENCQSWAQSYCGQGSIYYDFMTKNCRKSCGFCNDGGSGGGGDFPPGPIRDDCSHVRCRMVTCGRNEIQTQNEKECCPTCIALPSKGCTPVYKQVHLYGVKYQGLICDSKVPLLASSCFGVCASSSVLLFSGKEHSKCLCCKSYQTRTTSALLSCKRPHSHVTQQMLFEYEIILSCSCQPDNCPWSPGSFTTGREHGMAGIAGPGEQDESDNAAMDAFGDMFANIDAFNQ